MAIGVIVGIILVVLFIAACVGGYVASENGSGVGQGVCGALAVLLAIAFIIVPFSFQTINPGQIAVVKHLGEITHVRDSGTHFDLWFINAYDYYDTKVQDIEIATAAYSSDAQTMDVAMTLQYQINADKVTNIATQYGSLKTLEARITSIATAQTKSVLSKYKAMDIIADRASVSPAVEQAIKDAIGEEYCVNVQTVELINIDFSDAFEQAVEKKMIAEQEKLQAEYQNEQKIAQAKAEADAQIKKAEAEKEIAKAEAEAKKVQAEAEAEIKRIQAEAEAEAKKVAADAEAYANEKVAQSITDALLEKIYAENWDGKMPTVVGNGEYILPSDMIK